jgi:two-component system sensor histidine kinase KdpD
MLEKIASQMEQVFKAQTIALFSEIGGRLVLHPHGMIASTLAELDLKAADWAFAHGQAAGRFTENYPAAERLYVPLIASGGAMGVLGLRLEPSHPLSVRHWNLLDAFSQQIALALDRRRLRIASEKSKLVAESERLSKTLLSCMSHEMRTPLAAIKSAIEYLAEGSLSESQTAIVSEVEEATDRLNRLVGNVLDMTRLESGLVKPKFALCEVRDLVQVSVKETRRVLARHKITVDISAGMPLVRIDFVLMQQALMNLLSNAAVHTPLGTEVRVIGVAEASTINLSVVDSGLGVSPEEIDHIFDKFYRATTAPTGGTGLGLSVVKGFVEAQGGQISAENCAAGGLAVTLRLPLPSDVSPSSKAAVHA